MDTMTWMWLFPETSGVIYTPTPPEHPPRSSRNDSGGGCGCLLVIALMFVVMFLLAVVAIYGLGLAFASKP
jgi:hypothetical protein